MSNVGGTSCWRSVPIIHPPTTTSHMSELWHKLWHHLNSFLLRTNFQITSSTVLPSIGLRTRFFGFHLNWDGNFYLIRRYPAQSNPNGLGFTRPNKEQGQVWIFFFFLKKTRSRSRFWVLPQPFTTKVKFQKYLHIYIYISLMSNPNSFL